MITKNMQGKKISEYVRPQRSTKPVWVKSTRPASTPRFQHVVLKSETRDGGGGGCRQGGRIVSVLAWPNEVKIINDYLLKWLPNVLDLFNMYDKIKAKTQNLFLRFLIKKAVINVIHH